MRPSLSVSLGLMVTTGVLACNPETTAPRRDAAASHQANLQGAIKFWESGASSYWNGIARGLVVKYRSSPFAAIRGYAIVSTAQYNAVIAAEDGGRGRLHPSVPAAVARASAVALTYLYPAESAFLESLVAAQLSSPGWPGDANSDISAGEVVGRTVAEQVVARAQTDRFFAPWAGTVPVGPGIWFSTATPPAPPAGALFGQARTYFLTSGDQFRPSPPPAFGSPEYLAALAEVRHISDTRTPEQTAIARFWAFEGGTFTPPGFWNLEAANLVERYRLNERQAAHTFALVNMAGFDAIVACHDAKFAYWFIRPTQADPLITLPVALPNFPSYPSNHACLSAAQTTVLGSLFPAERSRLDAMADEAALSRLYAGIHYRFDCDVGLRLGRTVGALALSQDVKGHEPFVLK